MDLGEDELYRRLDRSSSQKDALPLVTYLLGQRWEPIARSGSWEQLLDVWKQGLSLNPRNFSEWQELDVLRALRHSIVHRLGQFTQQYRQKAEVKLKALGLEPAKATGLIPLTDSDVTDGLALGRRFIVWLDGELAMRAPAAR